MGRSSARAAVLCVTLLAAIGVAWAQEESTQTPCRWETAEPVTVRGLDGVEGGEPGRCVRVRAELDGWKLSAERPHRGLSAPQTDFIGAYSRDEALLDDFGEHPRRVEVLGTVGHCGDICAGASDTVICMAVGFCHYHDDPYIMIEDVR